MPSARRCGDGVAGMRAGIGEEIAETDDVAASTVIAGRSVGRAECRRGQRERTRRGENAEIAIMLRQRIWLRVDSMSFEVWITLEFIS